MDKDIEIDFKVHAISMRKGCSEWEKEKTRSNDLKSSEKN